ncbi:LINE-1 retrotransposable element ORF2 protein [Holothuria leucospilota]|uniref:LINE-1 retrotransposable element ORF2 protein n=1 Tax=Holothuria leucospilota TaxID=206669 RepID=A0A9Q1BDM8_HOLLE|nr:LINE-1 retrotransposable element ORF2 protein [Holothuria leucospilota]
MSRRVCILINPKLPFTVIKSEIDSLGRYFILDIMVLDQILTFVCIYGHNTDRPEFFVDLQNHLHNFQGDTIFIGDDFNFVFNLDLDKVGGRRGTSFKARNAYLALMSTFDLIDIWRKKNPLSNKFTWSSNVLPGIHCRLDFFLVSRQLNSNVSAVSLSPGIQSDHSL